MTRIERGLLDCAMKSVDTVRSGELRTIIVKILEKLVQVTESRIHKVLEAGRKMAASNSQLAVKWGNDLASEWRYIREYQWALGLGVLYSAV